MPWHASIYNVSYQRSGRGGLERRASHNCSAAIGDGGEKSRSDFREGVRCAWAKPSLDAMTTSNARMASGSPATLPAPCARPRRARARQKSSKSCAGDAHTPSMRLDSKGPDSGTREFLLRFRRQRMNALVFALTRFARRHDTKFTRAESCRVFDMVFLNRGWHFLGLTVSLV